MGVRGHGPALDFIGMSAFSDIANWPADNVAGALISGGEVIETVGDTAHRFPVASVTKPVVAYGVMMAVEEGALDLDQAAGPEGSTLRHLLAHASGVGFDSREPEKGVEEKRIYSSAGYEWAAELVEEATGIEFPEYLRLGIFEPLGMDNTALEEAAGHGLVSTAEDLVAFALEVMNPRLLAPETVKEMRTVQFPELRGTVPGYGPFNPCDWGLGFEIKGKKGAKREHWTGTKLSPETVGHFGMSGTYLWIDGDQAMVALTDHDFGDWAKPLWAQANDEIWAELNA